MRLVPCEGENPFPSYLWIMHHNLERNVGEFARLEDPIAHGNDANLLARIAVAFRDAKTTALGDADNQWLTYFVSANKESYRILAEGSPDEVAELLRNPVRSNLFHGFDGINAADQTDLHHDWWRWISAKFAYDQLLMLAEALGVERLENPETHNVSKGPDVEALLVKIDDAIGFRVDFPNPFQGEHGLNSSRGLISTRAVLALHETWRIFDICGRNPDVSVLEIGAGLGRNAYYAQKYGIKQYTIVDLPTTNVAQANFLGRVLNDAAVSLFNEDTRAPIKILPPDAFLSSADRYDLAANFDSMTEFSESTAINYLSTICKNCGCFISINHEANHFKVSDLLRKVRPGISISRHPWWMRRGYVEEVAYFK